MEMCDAVREFSGLAGSISYGRQVSRRVITVKETVAEGISNLEDTPMCVAFKADRFSCRRLYTIRIEFYSISIPMCYVIQRACEGIQFKGNAVFCRENESEGLE